LTFRSFRARAGDAVTHVVVGEGALAGLGERLARIAPGRWLAVSSRPVYDLHGAALVAATAGVVDPEPLLLPDGERAKTWAEVGRLLSQLAARGIRRDGGLVALGGGTVGDAGGLAASLVLRGVALAQVPTTLLAASDSALGGKTAVNLPGGKNLAGTVHQPALLVADTRLLATLDERAYRSGLAEVVKSSMLDAGFDRRFPRLQAGLARRDPAALAEAVGRSLRMKARVVEQDPLERTGARFALNLGHTVGHALESASRYRLAHGEAVAWGLLPMLELSVERGLPRRVADRLAARVLDLVRPPALSRGVLARWPTALGSDKKADRGGLRAVVLLAPGRAETVRTDRTELNRCLIRARERYN
jgi:3-dehydroquinate synthetase